MKMLWPRIIASSQAAGNDTYGDNVPVNGWVGLLHFVSQWILVCSKFPVKMVTHSLVSPGTYQHQDALVQSLSVPTGGPAVFDQLTLKYIQTK